MINVTKSFLPDLEEYVKYLEGIWERGHLTNHGPLVLELESKLRDYLGVKHFFFVNNGTIALQIAIKALGLKDEVITTPFSYVATTSSLVWEGCKPVFADIHPRTMTINADTISSVISDKTTGILATHVYGNPCPVEEITELAHSKGLKVIYDAAHAFGVNYNGKSVLNYGDISTLSFHATKLFHTIEGGGIVTNDDDLAHKISYMRNFGHNGPEKFFGVGVNGKSSEFQAAMGLCVLPKIDLIISRRKSISDLYKENLAGLNLQHLEIHKGTSSYNYAYFPVVFSTEEDLLKVVKALQAEGITPRRYFYPSLNTLDYVENNLNNSVAEDIAKRVLCLPMYPDLSNEEVNTITSIITSFL
ncbi:MAG: DegT/DnrJ/EryC1/StrS family aminotransferase [Bacteroidia bacterium]